MFLLLIYFWPTSQPASLLLWLSGSPRRLITSKDCGTKLEARNYGLRRTSLSPETSACQDVRLSRKSSWVDNVCPIVTVIISFERPHWSLPVILTTKKTCLVNEWVSNQSFSMVVSEGGCHLIRGVRKGWWTGLVSRGVDRIERCTTKTWWLYIAQAHLKLFAINIIQFLYSL